MDLEYIFILLHYFYAAWGLNNPQIKSRVYTEDYFVSLEGTLVSEGSWTSSRLPPTIEKSSVTCATACVDKFRKDSSCNSIMFVKETKECHMGFTSLHNDNETEPTEYVYRIPEGKGSIFGFSCCELSIFLLITFTKHKELVGITKWSVVKIFN